MSELENKYSENSENITFDESSKGYTAELSVSNEKLKQINNLELTINKNNVFDIPSVFQSIVKNKLSRKNEILYCISTQEQSIDIKNTTGSVYLPLITRGEIDRKLSTLPHKVRDKMRILHLGAVKILIKAHFRNGIHSPIKMALVDNRLTRPKEALLGAARGNLTTGKFMFTVYPKYGIPLETANLDKSLSFIHEFENRQLMNKGDKIFSVSYLVAYALTNSHHSIDYQNKQNIELEDVFRDIASVEGPQFYPLDDLEDSWTINLANNKLAIGEKPKPLVRGNTLHVGETSNPDFQSIGEKVDKLMVHLIGNQ